MNVRLTFRRAPALILAVLALSIGTCLPAAAQVLSSRKEVAVFQTPYGKFVVEFYPDTAPKHVSSFKKNVREGVYNGTAIHKIVPGFVIMGGDPFTRDEDPSNDGWGGFGPPVTNEYSSHHKNLRGALGSPRKPENVNEEQAWNGFQFYIVLADQPSLDASKHTVFGKVIEGLDIVDRMASTARDEKGVPRDRVEFKKVYLESR